MHKSVLACIVTYNRKELLIRNIESLLSQSYACDILVLDNCSTDNTYEYLLDNHYFDYKNIKYVKSEKNTGGSGGFYQCCEYGLNNSYDFLWLMDDDGYCMNQDTLKNIMGKVDNDNTIYNSLVLQNEKKLTFYIDGKNDVEEVLKLSNNGIIDNNANPFNGTLVSANILKKIGFIKKDFFIYGDETEFITRADSRNVKYCTVSDSKYFHPVNNPITKKVKLLNKEMEVTILPPWKLYCFTRNYYYIYNTYKSKREAFLFGLSMIVKYSLLKDDNKNNVTVIKKALRDAKNNNFSEDITNMMKKDYVW